MFYQKYLINFRYAFNIRKPKLILRLVNNFLSLLLTKRELLRYVDLQIGNKCNIRCVHCFANDYADHAGRITVEQFAGVVLDCMKMGAVNFSFQGGEPLLYKDLVDYIRAAKPNQNVISVSTNGMFITPEKCRELKKAGVDILTISIDEFRPVEYKEIMNKAKLARDCGLKTTIATVVSHENINSAFIQKIIDFAQRERMILVLILAAPVGEWESDEKILLTDEEVQTVKSITKRYAYVRLDFDATYIMAKCPAGTEVLYLTSEGDVRCCPFIPRTFGNIKTNRIGDIRERILQSDVLNKNRAICMAGEKQGKGLREMIEEGNQR